MTRRIRRPARARARQPHVSYGVPSERGTISPRAVMLLLLCGGPLLLIFGSFIFGVGLQTFGMVGAAKHGGFLGGIGSMALTVLIGAFLCIPGYLVAVIWYGVKTREFRDDVPMLIQKTMTIPLVALVMFWVPAVLIPNLQLGVRIQVAGLNVILMLIFGYLWIAIVRFAIKAFVRIRVIQYT